MRWLRADLMLTAVVAAALVASVVAIWWSASHDYLLLYDDSRSRLNITRRVFDNLQPGFAQLGTVWLPLHMLLMLPLVTIDPLYRSGVAGIIISVAAFLAVIVFVYRTAEELWRSRLAGVVAAAALVANPNVLYMQATPMSELLFMALYAGGWYFLIRWAATERLAYLYLSAGMMATASAVRYDGWFSVAVAVAIVVFIGFRRLDDRVRAEGFAVSFAALASFGMFLWLFYNWAIQGDPFAFAFGEGSGAAFASVTGAGLEGNAAKSALVFGATIVDTLGVVVAPLALVGGLAAMVRLRWSPRGLAAYGLWSVLVFNVLSLYLGTSVITHPDIDGDALLYNVRYGVLVAPVAAVFVAGLAGRSRWLLGAVIVLLAAQTALFARDGRPVTIDEPLATTSAAPGRVAARGWFDDHYDGGLVLVDLFALDSDVFYADVPQRRFVHVGVKQGGHPWDKALETPSAHVRWIYTNEDDGIFRALQFRADVAANFDEVFHEGKYHIYKRKF